MATKKTSIQAVQLSSQASDKRPFESLREVIGLISAGAGIFGVLLYLAGRSFASGYFAAMNIPNYQVSFSLWEYGEVAWFPMIIYPTLMLGASGLLWTVIYGLRDFVMRWLSRITEWLKRTVKVTRPGWLKPEFSRQTRQWFVVTLLALLVFIFMLAVENTLKFVEKWGSLSGQTYVVEKAAQVELISAIPLALDDNNLAAIQSSGLNYYIYQGLHLLTFNNDKYYLFKEIDPVTCMPLKVYVVNAEQNLQINLLPAASLAGQCHMNKSPQVIVTPMSTQVTP